MALTDFYPGTTKAFSVTIKLNGVTPNITGDTVRLLVKKSIDDPDSGALIDANADVATSGASGIALFDLTPTDTAIAPSTYHYDIVWYTGTDEYVLEQGTVKVVKRVSDL